MALIKTVKAKNGVTVNIFDDYMETNPKVIDFYKGQIRQTVNMIAENHRDELAAQGKLRHTKAQIDALGRAVDEGRMTLEEALMA